MSVSKFFMVGGVKLAGATVRGGMSVAYGIGGDLSTGFDAACAETTRQVELTKAHADHLKDSRARKLAVAQQLREQLAAKAAPAPMASVA